MKKHLPDWLLGVSFAASWTWAAAMLVGVSILREAGILPFVIWFVGNASAIPFFGWLSRKLPGLWDQTRRLPMRVLMSIMLMFTIWFNMTGIQTAGSGTGWFSFTQGDLLLKFIPIVTLILVWIATFKNGIKWSIYSDRVQWALELGSVMAIAVVAVVERGGFHVQPGLVVGSYVGLRGWILGAWTLPLLLSNPFLDGTFWHRAAYAKSMRPYWWGFAQFLVYLLCVLVIGLVGLTPIASNILFAVIFFASFSTLDACTAGLQLTAGKNLGNALGILSAFGWLIVANMGLLDVWVLLFSWYPFLFAIQLLTLWLEGKGILKPVDAATVAARDALPLFEPDE